jgi:quercetin dioxygenase-like cupin family protein
MKLVRFDAEVGKSLTVFGSHHVILSRILRTPDGVQIGCFYIQPGGVIALHQTAGPQLLLVVQGEGWVRDEGQFRTQVYAGQAVYWEEDEWHETGSESGLMAIVVEGKELEPDPFMQQIYWATGDA